MKVRQGFVSNSSSSSFIISINKSEECPHCKRKDSSFIDFIERLQDDYSGDSTKVHATTADRIIEYINDSYGLYLDDADKKKWESVFRKIKKAEKNGKEVAFISISYHDEIAGDEFVTQLRNKTIEKIWSDH